MGNPITARHGASSGHGVQMICDHQLFTNMPHLRCQLEKDHTGEHVHTSGPIQLGEQQLTTTPHDPHRDTIESWHAQDSSATS